ncbi:MAG: extracellular solute-binding protein [Opitutaceae bacterium]|nr:extracellular solute-binding protein [Opitutaceae bacterium]
MSTTLRGITWDHTRGFGPMVATAQRWHELHPEVEIVWEKRTLQAFADESIASLAQKFDLLVVDHPSMGEAAAHGLFLPLEQHLSADFLRDQAAHSTGASHASYQINGSQWALAIDAAAPIAGWREEVLAAAGERVPQTWDELLALARRGRVAFCGWPIDCLMYFYAFCVNEGEAPFGPDKTRVVSEAVGGAALRAIKELADACHPDGFTRNPIRTWEWLAAQEREAYCPFAYGYSNYARAGYAAHRLKFGGLVTRKGKPLTCTLGGTGLAISARTKQAAAALAYAQYVASGVTQTGIYTMGGGQPAHRRAWLDAENNRQTQDFFHDTLPVIENAYMRPRFDGYIDFQVKAPAQVVAALRNEITPPQALDRLNELYREYPAR